MKGTRITKDVIRQFQSKLTEEEKSDATKEKYLHGVREFAEYCGENELTKENVIAYKQKLLDDGYAVRSVNSVIASLNSLFAFLGRHDRKGYCQACRHSGAQQHQHDAHLYHFHGQRIQEANGTDAAHNIKKTLKAPE